MKGWLKWILGILIYSVAGILVTLTASWIICGSPGTPQGGNLCIAPLGYLWAWIAIGLTIIAVILFRLLLKNKIKSPILQGLAGGISFSVPASILFWAQGLIKYGAEEFTFSDLFTTNLNPVMLMPWTFIPSALIGLIIGIIIHFSKVSLRHKRRK